MAERMATWRGPTLRSLIEVLDRVIGRGVIVDSGMPVSPALAQLRRAAQGREVALPLETDAAAERLRALPGQEEAPDDLQWGRAHDEVREPPSNGGSPLD